MFTGRMEQKMYRMWAVSLLWWMVRDFVVLLGKVMVPVVVVLSVPIQHTLGCKQHPLKDADIYYDVTSTIPAMDPRACFPNGKKRSLKNFSKRMEDSNLLQVDLFLVISYTLLQLGRFVGFTWGYILFATPNIHKLGGAFGFKYVLFFHPLPGKRFPFWFIFLDFSKGLVQPPNHHN